MTGANAPKSEADVRVAVRRIADGLLLDALVSFAAMAIEAGYSTPETGELVVDEWSSACHAMGNGAKNVLDVARTDPTVTTEGTHDNLIAALGILDSDDDHVASMIQARVDLIRSARADAGA